MTDSQNQLPVININTILPSVETSEHLAKQMIDNLLEGNTDPLTFAVKKKCIEQAFDIVMQNEDVKNIIETEITRYGKEGAKILGATLSLRNNAKYNYEKDNAWKEIKEQMKPLEEALKAREEKIKIATKSGVSLISEDGEVIASPVPVKPSTSIIISFKK